MNIDGLGGAPMSTQPSLTQHKITVLLIDDQPLIGEAVRRMLAKEQDIEFHFCKDPAKALETAASVSPTVILQDLVMPAVVRLIPVKMVREDDAKRDCPTLVLSSKV